MLYNVPLKSGTLYTYLEWILVRNIFSVYNIYSEEGICLFVCLFVCLFYIHFHNVAPTSKKFGEIVNDLLGEVYRGHGFEFMSTFSHYFIFKKLDS
jgi:hypothetical protein